MRVELSDQEEQFVRKIVDWDLNRRRAESFVCSLFLFLGGAIIVFAAYITVQHLSDRTALSITVPGFLLGLVLIGLYLIVGRRIRERRLVASVLKKLRSAG